MAGSAEAVTITIGTPLRWSSARMRALTVLRQASQPLGPMGVEWLERQERDL
jgi:hypothetical protein